MKSLRNLVFQIGKGCAFIVFSALTCFASCERSGYQGIPLRNGLNRGAIAQVESIGAHAYSGLPQRLHQTERDAAYSASTAQDQQCADNAEANSGYSGIPHSTARGELNMQQGNSFLGTGSAFVRPK